MKVLNKLLDCKEQKINKSLTYCHTSRYSNQKKIKILFCEGYNSKELMTCSNVTCIDVYKVGDVEAYPSMKMVNYLSKEFM